MTGIQGMAGLTGILLATVMASAASAAVPGEICKSAPVEVVSPVVPAAEVAAPPAENKDSKDCPTSSEPRADDDVCVYTPGMEKERAPAQQQSSPQVSSEDKGKGFIAQLLRTAGHVWSAVVTTLSVVTQDARI
jgi:hypothetical protein